MEENFDKYMGNLRSDMEKVLEQVRALLPKYAELKAKSKLTDEEQKVLGDIEYVLIEASPYIEEIRNLIKRDLFGNSLDYYYHTKSKAQDGNIKAKEELDRLRKFLMNDFFEKDEIMN
ncbi:MAG: hypothetical protein KDC84_09090 [Crocinitomicaceae bacterium]|nr:hypothetical protein [Crocinitomicaceae bacterium]